jgi:hypothetical protein
MGMKNQGIASENTTDIPHQTETLKNKRSTIGIWGFILSIIGYFFCLTEIPALIFCIFGIVRKSYRLLSWLGLIISLYWFVSLFQFYLTFTGSAIGLPDGDGQIVFLIKPAHPFLAEYERKIRFETKAFPKLTKQIQIDPGGDTTHREVYWYAKRGEKGPYIKFFLPKNSSDTFSPEDFIIDLDKGKIYRISYEGGIGILEIRGESDIVQIDENEKRELCKWLNQEKGQYIGYLDAHRAPFRSIYVSANHKKNNME